MSEADLEARAALALVTVERAEHGLPPCEWNTLTDQAQALYLTRARAIVAALRSSDRTGEGWQPIETAPRDGTRIMLWLGAPWSAVETARWYATWKNWQVGTLPADPAREEYHGIGSMIPTHWCRLPAPPARAALGEEG